jgi:hypothetical protein
MAKPARPPPSSAAGAQADNQVTAANPMIAKVLERCRALVDCTPALWARRMVPLPPVFSGSSAVGRAARTLGGIAEP